MSSGLHGHNKKYFRQIPRESEGFKVTQNENFGLRRGLSIASLWPMTYRASRKGEKAIAIGKAAAVPDRVPFSW
jgi:hypothetical protein